MRTTSAWQSTNGSLALERVAIERRDVRRQLRVFAVVGDDVVGEREARGAFGLRRNDRFDLVAREPAAGDHARDLRRHAAIDDQHAIEQRAVRRVCAQQRDHHDDVRAVARRF